MGLCSALRDTESDGPWNALAAAVLALDVGSDHADTEVTTTMEALAATDATPGQCTLK
jgi:hypothetical protein